MNSISEAAAAIHQMVTLAMKSNHEGLLSTVSPMGLPHSTWMGCFCTPDFAHLITLTGIHTEKVTNIKVNPGVEWMFSSPDRLTVVYLQGRAEIILDESVIHKYTQLIPHESRAAFMNYYRSGGEWCVLKTHIENAIYSMPAAYTKVQISGHQLGLHK